MHVCVFTLYIILVFFVYNEGSFVKLPVVP